MAARDPSTLLALVGDAARGSARAVLRAEPSVAAVVLDDPEPATLALARSEPGDGVAGTAVRGRDGTVTILPGAPVRIDRLPWPDRPYLACALAHRPVADVLSSRGCASRCTFCIVGSAYSGPGTRPAGWRARDPEDVAAEVGHLAREHGVRRIHFADDNFIGTGARGRARAARIGESIAALGVTFSCYCRADDVDAGLFGALAAAGLRLVHLGIESGAPGVLRRLRKDVTAPVAAAAVRTLRGLGIGVIPSMIVFEQRQDLDELRTTLRWMLDTGVTDGFSTGGLMPLPGSLAARELADAGLFPQGESGWLAATSPVAFADPRVGRVRDVVCGFERLLGDEPGRLAASYHRRNERIDVHEELDVSRHGALRRRETEMALAVAESLARGEDVPAEQVAAAWSRRWCEHRERAWTTASA